MLDRVRVRRGRRRRAEDRHGRAVCPWWWLGNGVACALPVRERRILAVRFFGDLTQAEIAEQVGVSQMHISRLLIRVLAQLRTSMLDDEQPRARPAARIAPRRR